MHLNPHHTTLPATESFSSGTLSKLEIKVAIVRRSKHLKEFFHRIQELKRRIPGDEKEIKRR